MPRSRKNEKGILEVGFFIVKKQAHYPTSSCSPQAAGTAPRHYPSPYKTKGNKEGGRRRDILRIGNVWVTRAPVSKPAKHRKDRFEAACPFMGQGRARRCPRALQLSTEPNVA